MKTVFLRVFAMVGVAWLLYLAWWYAKTRRPTYPMGSTTLYEVAHNLEGKPEQCALSMVVASPIWLAWGQERIFYVHACDRYRPVAEIADGFEINDNEHTGLISDDAEVWFHPPRSGPLYITQSAPYPYFVLATPKGGQYEFTNDIPETSHVELKQNGDTITSYYTYVGDTAWADRGYPLAHGAKKIEAYQDTRLGRARATFYFVEGIGFVRMHYRFPNGRYAVFTLTALVR